MTLSATGSDAFIAGAYDPGQASVGAGAEYLSRALADAATPSAVAGAGPLAIAVHRAGDPPDLPLELPLCALDGSIDNLAAVAEAAGLPPLGEPAEVTLARAYLRLGSALVEKLRGDFAIVLWDRQAERGVIARDQLGGRGIVWHELGGRLLFASEVRQLLLLLPRVPAPDRAAVAHWVACSGIPPDRTLYAGIQRLPAAHLISLENGRWDVRRYWSPRYRRPLRAPFPELVERVRGAAREAVARRCRAEGEVGLLLSGGIDSTSIAALAAGLPPGQQPRRAYSATFPSHPDVDESEQIDIVARRARMATVRAVVRRGGGIESSLPYLAYWKLPALTPNLCFWQPLLGRAAADGIAGVLTGEGGDELFGNAPPLMADYLRQGRFLAARRVPYRISSRGGPPPKEDVRRMVRPLMREFGFAAATPSPLHGAIRQLRGWRRYAPDWLNEATARAYVESHDPTAWKRTRAPRWWAYRLDRISTGLGAAPIYDDSRRRGSQLGLEARHPFRDVDLVELILRLPVDVFFDRRWSRPLLREAMEGLLPDEIRLRPGKSSFDAVSLESLAGPELGIARALLSSTDAELGAFVDLLEARKRLFDREPPDAPGARARWGAQVWRLVTAECWLRSLADPKFPSRLAEEGSLPNAEVEILQPA